MGVIRTLGREGDVETKWYPSKPSTVKAAEEVFRQNVLDGLLPFRTDTGVGEQIKAFDPDAREIIFTHRLVGG